jgi:hypothetical protein
VKKGYLKVAVDIKQIVAIDYHLKRFMSLKKVSKNFRVKSVLADGAYDSRENFTFLSDNNIEPLIRVRSNSIAKSRGCLPRK